jgi:hypothetical protein
MVLPSSRIGVRSALAATARACLMLALAAAGCGGGGAPPPREPAAPAAPPKTEFQRRQEAACDALGPRLTQCAYESAKRTLTPAEMKKQHVEEKRADHTALFVDKCRKQQMSSRQIRVYEVCMREERECEPLISCLEYAKPQATPPAGK